VSRAVDRLALKQAQGGPSEPLFYVGAKAKRQRGVLIDAT
jgi:hypothetical protein